MRKQVSLVIVMCLFLLALIVPWRLRVKAAGPGNPVPPVGPLHDPRDGVPIIHMQTVTSAQLKEFPEFEIFGDSAALPSPSGRYVAVRGKTLKDGEGLYILELETGRWHQVNHRPLAIPQLNLDGKPHYETLIWLPDESAILADEQESQSSSLHNFMLHTLDGKVLPLMSVTCQSWSLLPDGSAMVVTNAEKECQVGYLTTGGMLFVGNFRLKVYDLRRHRWRNKDLLTPELYTPPSIQPTILRHHEQWVATFPCWKMDVKYSSGSWNSTFWVNLTTGETASGAANDMVGSQHAYSPDGRHLLLFAADGAEGTNDPSRMSYGIYATYSWPQPAAQGAAVLSSRIATVDLHFTDLNAFAAWSPDSRSIFGTVVHSKQHGGDDSTFTDCFIYDLSSRRPVKRFTLHGNHSSDMRWAGPNALIARDNLHTTQRDKPESDRKYTLSKSTWTVTLYRLDGHRQELCKMFNWTKY